MPGPDSPPPESRPPSDARSGAVRILSELEQGGRTLDTVFDGLEPEIGLAIRATATC